MPSSFMQQLFDNIRNMRFSMQEFSGSLGDLGTFIPLTVALSLVTGMELGPILIFAGLANIVTGAVFGLPAAVQPMKAIVAVAIAEQLLPLEIAAAGILVGSVVLFLGVSGFIEKIERFVPLSVIRGIQLGIGIKLGIKGIEFINETAWFDFDSVTTAIGLGVIVLALSLFKRFPSALLLLVVGIVIMIITTPSGALQFTPGLVKFGLSVPDAESWRVGLIQGALPQLPLTLLNSVLAVCALSGDLFPGKRISTKKMAVSVGMMNLMSLWFGAMPMCHGSGGLAGQHFFGARTGGSLVMLGGAMLLIGTILGISALSALNLFPMSVLGVMLLFAGLELASPARDQRVRSDFLVMALTAVGILAVNTVAGFVFGLAASLLLRSNRDDDGKATESSH